MKRGFFKPIFVMIITLGAFGFIYTIVKQPIELLQKLLFILLFVGIVYGIYKLFMRKRSGRKEHLAYMRAAKQSKRRLHKNSNKKAIMKGVKKFTPLTKHRLHLEKKKNEVHLTVIEGKKGKKKNRASF